MSSLRYRMFLRTLYRAVLGSPLSTSDLKALSVELRRGQLADELAYMIDRAFEHLGSSENDAPEDKRVEEAERLIREWQSVQGGSRQHTGEPRSASLANQREHTRYARTLHDRGVDFARWQAIGDTQLAPWRRRIPRRH